MNWFWHAIWICLVVIPVTILWCVGIFDVVFRRHDLRAWTRVGLLIMILFLPVIGVLIYFGLTRGPETPGDYEGEPSARASDLPYQSSKIL